MKICLINNLYKPYNRGGAERIVEIIAHGLEKSGHQVFIITTRPLSNPKKHKDEIKTYRFRSLNAVSYYNLGKVPMIFRIFWHLADMFDIGSYFKVKSILKKEQPDVVMTHNLKGVGFLIPRVIKCLDIKHLHTLHDVQLIHPSGLMFCGKEKRINSILSKIYTSLLRWLFKSPDTVISPSQWLMDLHLEKKFFSDSKTVILPNPAPIKISHHIPLQETMKPRRLLYVGQIEMHKGILFLIRSFLSLSNQGAKNNCELIIIGNGSKLKQAKKLAQHNTSIKFIPYNRKELIKYMQSSTALIVPSLCYENSPTVIYEAASVGMPVIASRIGGIPELIHELGGLLFAPGNEGDLMYQLKWLMEHPEKAKQIKIQEKTAIKKFQADKYIEKLEKLIC